MKTLSCCSHCRLLPRGSDARLTTEHLPSPLNLHTYPLCSRYRNCSAKKINSSRCSKPALGGSCQRPGLVKLGQGFDQATVLDESPIPAARTRRLPKRLASPSIPLRTALEREDIESLSTAFTKSQNSGQIQRTDPSRFSDVRALISRPRSVFWNAPPRSSFKWSKPPRRHGSRTDKDLNDKLQFLESEATATW